MEREHLSRKLAVILHADVVESTALVRANETLAHQRIQDLFQRFSATISRCYGTTHEIRGDALVAEFPRASDAVSAALSFQRDNKTFNHALNDNIQPGLRIGISLGEVVIADNTMTGEGIVLAQRLEQLAEAGGVCIQGAAYETIPKRLPFIYENLGEQQVKGFDEPIKIFAVGLDPEGEVAEPEAMVQSDTATPALPDRPSIVVLPFDNMSGDSEQEYFADGITEDLITALSKIRWFFVIARNSAFTYKGQAVDVTRVAQELGVQYVIEGSMRKAGDRIRINAQLIDAKTGRHVWAESYDRSLGDIFELQDEMTQTIAGAVEPELSAAEQERAVRKAPESLGAWEKFQRGLWHMWNFNKEDVNEAKRLFQQVHGLDPTFATSYAFESYCCYLSVMLAFTDAPQKSIEEGVDAAKRALALDDKDPVAYLALGRIHTMAGEHDAAIAEHEKSLELSPSFYLAHHGLGFALALSGRLEEAAESLHKAIRISPRDPLLWGTKSFLSLTYNLLQQFEKALDWANKSIQEPRAVGGGYWPYATLASALGNLDQKEDANSAIEQALQHKPDLTLSFFKTTLPTRKAGGLDPFLNGLRKAGLPD